MDEVHLWLLCENGGKGRVGRVQVDSSMLALLISYAIGCCRFRLKTLHFLIHSMDQRVFCFDDGIFGLKEFVLQIQLNVFRLKSGVSGLYLSL